MTTEGYHYTESGLDNVYLANGFEYVNGPNGREVVITDLDGLHEAIGRMLVYTKKDLTGRDIRFLRHEMVMSQKTLAAFLQVSEQAIARWEKGKSDVPKPAEAWIRALYHEHVHHKGVGSIRANLRRLADLEHAQDRNLRDVRLRHDHKWRPELKEAA